MSWQTTGISLKGPPGEPAPLSLFQGRSTGAQTVAVTNTWYPVLFPAEDFDDSNGHSTTSNTSRFTAPATGVYRVSGSVIWVGGQSLVSPRRRLRLAINGSTQVPGSVVFGEYQATGLTMFIPPMLVGMNGGQYIEMHMDSLAAGAAIHAAGSECALFIVERVR